MGEFWSVAPCVRQNRWEEAFLTPTSRRYPRSTRHKHFYPQAVFFLWLPKVNQAQAFFSSGSFFLRLPKVNQANRACSSKVQCWLRQRQEGPSNFTIKVQNVQKNILLYSLGRLPSWSGPLNILPPQVRDASLYQSCSFFWHCSKPLWPPSLLNIW